MVIRFPISYLLDNCNGAKFILFRNVFTKISVSELHFYDSKFYITSVSENTTLKTTVELIYFNCQNKQNSLEVMKLNAKQFYNVYTFNIRTSDLYPLGSC